MASPAVTEPDRILRECDCSSIVIRCAHHEGRRVFLGDAPVARCDCEEGPGRYSITFMAGPMHQCSDCVDMALWPDQLLVPTCYFDDYDEALAAFYDAEAALLRGDANEPRP